MIPGLVQIPGEAPGRFNLEERLPEPRYGDLVHGRVHECFDCRHFEGLHGGNCVGTREGGIETELN